MEQTHCTFRLGCGEGPAQDTVAETHPPPGVSPTAARQRARETHLSNTSTRRPPQSPPSICPRIISHGPGFKHSPPVRLKEFPKAENELRGVKSGLLGLLTGLHRPELSVGREEDNTQECDGPWRQIHRSQLRTAGPASARARGTDNRATAGRSMPRRAQSSGHSVTGWEPGSEQVFCGEKRCFFLVYLLAMEDLVNCFKSRIRFLVSIKQVELGVYLKALLFHWGSSTQESEPGRRPHATRPPRLLCSKSSSVQ